MNGIFEKVFVNDGTRERVFQTVIDNFIIKVKGIVHNFFIFGQDSYFG